jgi:hypothetical protein
VGFSAAVEISVPVDFEAMESLAGELAENARRLEEVGGEVAWQRVGCRKRFGLCARLGILMRRSSFRAEVSNLSVDSTHEWRGVSGWPRKVRRRGACPTRVPFPEMFKRASPHVCGDAEFEQAAYLARASF